jgi:hypothetical protein
MAYGLPVSDGSDQAVPEAQRTHDENGVDLTLIRAYLDLSPTQRLQSLQNAVRAIQRFRSLVGETRSPRRVSTDVEEGPSAECPIGAGSTCPSPAQRGRGEPGTNLGHEVLAPSSGK